MANENKTIIGKDVIESLTLGMYEDSRFIYREYIQNAADQIDKAVEIGILKDKAEGRIQIQVDKRTKCIEISDNATGIESNSVDNILRNIAQSTKKRGINKGFRGIGRLGGLGYCDILEFETSYLNENVKTIMTWNAKGLKHIINNRNKKESASDVIDQLTQTETFPESAEKHYFTVRLKNVQNETLLDRDKIKDYLSLIAPVKFHPRFMFNQKIYKNLESNNLNIDEYSIFINTDEIFKKYTTSIYKVNGASKIKIDELFDIDTFIILNGNKKILAWGWYGLSKFEGVIPSINTCRGLRLRKDNIQIGTEYTLDKFHKQEKNNRYFLGEVHAYGPNLIPNARRDYFLENNECNLLEEQLRLFFDSKLKPLFNIASKIRAADRKIAHLKKKKEEVSELNKTGITNKAQIKKIEEELEVKKDKAKEGQKTLINIQTKIKKEKDHIQQKLFDRITTNKKTNINNTTQKIKKDINSLPCRTEKYSKLSRKERKLISTIFEVIDLALNKDLADNLKKKIDEKFE